MDHTNQSHVPLYPGAPPLPPLSSSPRSTHSHHSDWLAEGERDRAGSRQNSGSSAGGRSTASTSHQDHESSGLAGRGARRATGFNNDNNSGNFGPQPAYPHHLIPGNKPPNHLNQPPRSPTARSLSPNSTSRTNRSSIQLNNSSLAASQFSHSPSGPYSRSPSSRPPPSPTDSNPPSRPGSSSSRHPHPHDSQASLAPSGYRTPKRQGSGDRDRDTSRHPNGSDRPTAGICSKCELPLVGSFVRALGTVMHVECFTCGDCGSQVAAKFFALDAPDRSGRQIPLCERDYFRRLDMLCTKCGEALRGSYITTQDHKWHTDCFCCSVCPVVFGPNDSYYEHDGKVYCHFHYSTRFAVKCTGCRTAILKQYVEINRNSEEEHWHPECYMIHKFWNIKMAPSPPVITSPDDSADPANTTAQTQESTSAKDAYGPPSKALTAAEYEAAEEKETPESLKAKQKAVERQVLAIWNILSAFEESSAACISEMLRFVSSGQYLDGVKQAEKFVFHVEVLFSAIDKLSQQFKQAKASQTSHVREARMLCKKVVNFFSLLSHTHETGARKMSITQELLSLVTGLAHYLKILIRIALTSALRLERDHGNQLGISHFLDRLDKISKAPGSKDQPGLPHRECGYQSLTSAVGLVGQGEAFTDLCEGCKATIEEECARLGTSSRWHLGCLKCSNCGVASTKPDPTDPSTPPPSQVRQFRAERASSGGLRPLCGECAAGGTLDRFEYVTRLEQYAFLLCVALNKLYGLLKQRGPVVVADGNGLKERSLYDTYRDSNDIKRMKSVNLDRKLSSTTAKLPKRSTVVQSPSGRVAQSSSDTKPPIPSRKDQPLLDPSRATTIPRPTLPSQPTPSRSETGPAALSRPTYNRATTAVKVLDDPPRSNAHALAASGGSGLGGLHEPTLDEEGLTLADLAQVMEVEQAIQQRRPVGHGRLLSELSALEYFIVKHAAALALAAECSPFRNVTSLDELLELIDAKKNNFWGKLFKTGQEKKPIKKKGVFGIPLEVLVERNGADSMHGAGAEGVRIPSFVDDVVVAMRQMDMSIEGIFRKNGNIRRLKDLTEALDRDATSVNLSEDNPVQLAALLKKFLRDLPDPIMTFKLFHLFIATQRIDSEAERRRTLHLVCCLMPKAHRDTLEVLCVFLKWVASFSHVDEETGSKMDLQNLATVICPNILYAKGKDPTKDESFLAVRCVHELLEWQDEMWTVPDEFEAILDDHDLTSRPDQLTSKEILGKAEQYVGSRSRSASHTRPRGLSRAVGEPPGLGGGFPQRPDFTSTQSAPALASANTRSATLPTGIAGGQDGNLAARPGLEREYAGERERPVSFSAASPGVTSTFGTASSSVTPVPAAAPGVQASQVAFAPSAPRNGAGPAVSFQASQGERRDGPAMSSAEYFRRQQQLQEAAAGQVR